MFFNCLDPEINDLLRLKHPTTPLSKKVELLDYSLVFNEEFRKRVAMNGDWLLVSKKAAPDLHEAFYDKRELFPELLDKYLTSGNVVGQIVKARDIAPLFLQQRQDTGRIYSFNVDHANDHTPFKETIRTSNLCAEIALPSRPYSSSHALNQYHEYGEDGLVGLCFLLALDVGKIQDDAEYKLNAFYSCRALDNIITNMFYPFESLRSVGEGYRSIGVGITNLAYYMARNNVMYDTSDGRNVIHNLAERHMFMIYTASNDLAKEKGVFKWYDNTKYVDGYLSIDSYNREIDNHHTTSLLYDWDELRANVKEHGLRFSTHVAFMPCESSSVWSFGANGLYPIRSGLVIKSRPEGLVPFIPPEYDKYKDSYQFAWDISNRDMSIVYGIFQKFCDQAISADEYVDFSQKIGGKSSMNEMIVDWLFHYKVGNKSQYYKNTKTESDTTSGNVVEEDDGCESCKL